VVSVKRVDANGFSLQVLCSDQLGICQIGLLLDRVHAFSIQARPSPPSAPAHLRNLCAEVHRANTRCGRQLPGADSRRQLTRPHLPFLVKPTCGLGRPRRASTGFLLQRLRSLPKEERPISGPGMSVLSCLVLFSADSLLGLEYGKGGVFSGILEIIR
jgi:hypothetical protein